MQTEIHGHENSAGTCKKCQAQNITRSSILVKSTNPLKVN